MSSHGNQIIEYDKKTKNLKGAAYEIYIVIEKISKSKSDNIDATAPFEIIGLGTTTTTRQWYYPLILAVLRNLVNSKTFTTASLKDILDETNKFEEGY